MAQTVLESLKALSESVKDMESVFAEFDTNKVLQLTLRTASKV